MIQGADVVWIIRCARCEQRDLSRWWAHSSDATAPPEWSCESCGDLDFHFAAISWQNFHRLRRGLEKER
jgi:hypothetical protein